MQENDISIHENNDFAQNMAIPQGTLPSVMDYESIDLPWCQEYIKTILCDTKKFKTIKNTLEPTSKGAWQNKIQVHETRGGGGGDWNHFYKIPHLCIRYINLRMFQYNILHRILPTKRKLKQY